MYVVWLLPTLQYKTLVVFCDADFMCPVSDPLQYLNDLTAPGHQVIRIAITKQVVETARQFIGGSCHDLPSFMPTEGLRGLGFGTTIDINRLVRKGRLFEKLHPVRAALSALFLDDVIKTTPGIDSGMLSLIGQRAPTVDYFQPLGCLGTATMKFLTSDPSRMSRIALDPSVDQVQAELWQHAEWAKEAEGHAALLRPLSEAMTPSNMLAILWQLGHVLPLCTKEVVLGGRPAWVPLTGMHVRDLSTGTILQGVESFKPVEFHWRHLGTAAGAELVTLGLDSKKEWASFSPQSPDRKDDVSKRLPPQTLRAGEVIILEFAPALPGRVPYWCVG